MFWATILGAVPALGDYKAYYREGLRQFDLGHWRDSVILFGKAVKENPRAGGRPIRRGDGARAFEPYVPYYFLGRCFYNLNMYAEAEEAWRRSEQEGILRGRKHRRMKGFQQKIPAKVEAEAKALRQEIKYIREALQALENGPNIVRRTPRRPDASASLGPDASVADVRRQINKIDELLGEVTAVSIADVKQLLENIQRTMADISDRQLIDQQVSEHQQARHTHWQRRLQEADTLNRKACSPKAKAILHDLLLEKAPNPEDELTPYLALANAHLQCSEFSRAQRIHAIAERRAALFDQRPAELKRLASRIDQARRAAAAVSAYDKAEAMLATPGCHPIAIELLEGPVAAWWEGWVDTQAPGGRPIWTPHLLLARAKLECGFPEMVSEAIHRAAERNAPQAEIEALRKKLINEPSGLSPTELRRRWLDANRRATAQIARGGCHDQAIMVLETLLRWGWSTQVREAAIEAALFFDLAQGLMQCRRFTEAERAIAQAKDAGLAIEALTTLEATLAEIRERDSSRRARERYLHEYLIATAQVSLGECGADIDRQLEVAGLENRDRLPADFYYEPLLAKAHAKLNCGDLDKAEDHLRQAKTTLNEPRQVRQILDLEERIRQIRKLSYTESHALLIAAADYQNGWDSLQGVHRDFSQLKRVLSAHGFKVHPLLNPTKAEFITKVMDFVVAYGAAPDHRILVYFAGHGDSKEDESEISDIKQGYIVPVDALVLGPDNGSDYIKSLISMTWFEGLASILQAKHAAFIFDSCFSGMIFDPYRDRMIRAPESSLSIEEQLSLKVRLFITAGGKDDQVPDTSIFRQAVVDALEGHVSSGSNGLFLGSDLGRFVKREGQSNYNTPQWGKMNDPLYNRGDIGFHMLKSSGEISYSSAKKILLTELEHWKAIWESEDHEPYQSHIEIFPEGHFTPLAKLILDRLVSNINHHRSNILSTVRRY